MSRQLKAPLTWALVLVIFATGCHPSQPFYFHNDGDLSHYLDKVTRVESPDADHESLDEVKSAHSPLTVSNPEFKEIWDVTLQEAVQIALQNSKVIRNAGALQANFGFSDALIERVQGFATVYDPAIQESLSPGTNRLSFSQGTGPLANVNGYGLARSSNPIGVEAALADFDAQFGSNMNFAVDDRPNNISPQNTSPLQRLDFRQHGTQSAFGNTPSGFNNWLTKKTASGARFWLRSRTDYVWNNNPTVAQTGSPFSKALPHQWTQTAEIEWDQPLMRGRGALINRIPVILARINTDISVAAFESAVRNMMMDLEAAYWDLHFAYRNLETSKVGRDSALGTWKVVYEKWSKGVSPTHEEAQARGQYFQFRGQVEAALAEVYSAEGRLRWLMGLAHTDGRLIRPKDEPTFARVEFDWNLIHAEALYRNVELRQQKWTIKQREMELISAKNQLLPDLDFSVIYRLVGAGDDLVNANRNGLNFPAQGSTAFDNLAEGKYQEAYAGMSFIPARFGARTELAAIRNAQLAIARTKAQLEEMELNQSHLLTIAIRNLDRDFVVAQSNYNRWVAAEKEVNALQDLFEGGRETLDHVLDAQRRLSQAKTDYYRALVDYNKSLALVHYRKGSLLEHNGIGLAEGPWPEKAYWDALGRARERDASYYLNYGFTRPQVISAGEVNQKTGQIEPKSFSGPTVESPEAIPATNPDAMPATPEESRPQSAPITGFPGLGRPQSNFGASTNSEVQQASANLEGNPTEGSFTLGNRRYGGAGNARRSALNDESPSSSSRRSTQGADQQ